MNKRIRHPFGEESCEQEMEVYEEKYKSYYFNEAPFNQKTLEVERYLIVGRRGTGKSSLGQYFNFQTKFKNAICIHLKAPDLLMSPLQKIATIADVSRDLAIYRMMKIWDYIIWAILFEKFKTQKEIKKANRINSENGPAFFAKELINNLLRKYTGSDTLSDELEIFLSETVSQKAKTKIEEIAQKNEIIIAIDSFESYDIKNEPIIASTAALIQFASEFNLNYAYKGIQIKVFITAEVFPYLCNQVILNVGKSIRSPVYLNWRPRDLVKLVSWRFNMYLKQEKIDTGTAINLDWSKFPDILKNMWEPFFSKTIKNSCGIAEKSFPYVLRHTQMRPRQLIIICNKIAEISKKNNNFPIFSNDDIRKGIKKTENFLATEIYNSYSRKYKNLPNIVGALYGIPLVFKGNLLDSLAYTTSSAWTDGDYSQNKFHQLVTELGIVGKVKSYDENTKIIQADFEYAMEDSLLIVPDEDYVIHPMFFSKLNVTKKNGCIVLPFPDNSQYKEIMLN